MKKLLIALSLLLLVLNNEYVVAQEVTKNNEPFAVNLGAVMQSSEIGLSKNQVHSVQVPAVCCRSMVEFQKALGGTGLYYLFDGYTRKQITSQNLADVIFRLKDKTKAVNLTVYRVKNS